MNIATSRTWLALLLSSSPNDLEKFRLKPSWLKPFCRLPVTHPVFQLPQGGFIDGYRILPSAASTCALLAQIGSFHRFSTCFLAVRHEAVGVFTHRKKMNLKLAEV
ncbi:MAG: hypothetical protein MUC59_16340 [Saprospiraceae bacterium]|jgi:hypothetical protein|nr:hypothetical protein [Saprospiraceae bacterium]